MGADRNEMDVNSVAGESDKVELCGSREISKSTYGWQGGTN